MRKLRGFVFLFSLIPFILSSQDQKKIDSLVEVIVKAKEDTSKVQAILNLGDIFILTDLDKTLMYEEQALALVTKLLKNVSESEKTLFQKLMTSKGSALGNIGYAYIQKGELEKALFYMNKGLEVCEKINDNKNLGEIYLNIGYINLQKGDPNKSIVYFDKALIVMQKAQYKLGQANALNNLAGVYMKLGNIQLALEQYQKSLKIAEELRDKEAMGYLLSNIGTIYDSQKESEKAFEYYKRALIVREELNDKKGVVQSLVMIGVTLNQLNQPLRALEFSDRALKVAEEIKLNEGLCRALMGRSEILVALKRSEEALEVLERALKIAVQGSLKATIARCNSKIGMIYYLRRDFDKAESYNIKALDMVTKMGFPAEIRDVSAILSYIYAQKNKFKEAYEMQRLHKRMSDSLLNTETQKNTARQQAKYEFEKKEALAKIEQEKKDEIAASEAKQQRIITWASVIGLILFFAFSISLFQRFKVTARQKKIIEEKNHLVEEKNKDITDSINYASRIQNAILKAEEHVNHHLPVHFVLFRPKDIVSGDFHWMLEKKEYLYMAAADCTGHGVPGAFLTMLGVSFLNEINGVADLLMPAEILDKLRSRIIKELGQTGKALENKDGMDISLARLNLKTLELDWAGANNPLYYWKNSSLNEVKADSSAGTLGKLIEVKADLSAETLGKLIEVKADKQPVAFYADMKPFTNNKFQLNKGDIFYLFTDGYADQFGGPKGKKFKYKQFQEKILETQSLSVIEQKQELNSLFENWKGTLEQVDDVCIIGVRL